MPSSRLAFAHEAFLTFGNSRCVRLQNESANRLHVTTVEITAWSRGFQSPQCVQLLRSLAGLAQAEATRVVENILKGKAQQVAVRSAADARMMVAALAKLGATAHVKAPD